MTEDVKKAIMLDKSSTLYPIMDIILSYEEAEWDKIDEISKEIQLDVNKVPELYLQAIKWADDYLLKINNIQK